MRNFYVVTYDISDPKRLRATYRCLRAFGQWMQLSVFGCRLNRRQRLALEVALHRIIDKRADQVLFFDMGPAEGTAPERIKWLGRPPAEPDDDVAIL